MPVYTYVPNASNLRGPFWGQLRRTKFRFVRVRSRLEYISDSCPGTLSVFAAV